MLSPVLSSYCSNFICHGSTGILQQRRVNRSNCLNKRSMSHQQHFLQSALMIQLSTRSSCFGAKFQHFDTARHCIQQGGDWSHRADPAVLHKGHRVGLFGMIAPWSEVVERSFVSWFFTLLKSGQWKAQPTQPRSTAHCLPSPSSSNTVCEARPAVAWRLIELHPKAAAQC